MRLFFRLAIGVALTGLATTANAAVITFDSLATNSVVGTQSGATFFTPSGDGEVRVFTGCCSHTDPNSIGSHAGSGFNFNGDVNVTFATAVNNLMFYIGGDDRVGVAGLVDVFGTSGLLGTFSLIADGNSRTEELQNLSAFLNVTGINIRNVTDPAGLVYDTFSFNEGAAAVPEPATLSLLGLGLAGLAARRRTKRLGLG